MGDSHHHKPGLLGKLKEAHQALDARIQERLKSSQRLFYDADHGGISSKAAADDSPSLESLPTDGALPASSAHYYDHGSVEPVLRPIADVDFLAGYVPPGSLSAAMASVPNRAQAVVALNKAKAAVMARPEVAELVEVCGITADEADALVLYTLEEGGMYAALNTALHDYYCEVDRKAVQPLMGFAFYLTSCLRKLPLYREPSSSRKTTVWRGLSMPLQALRDNYVEHRDVYWSGFTSTSTRMLTALSFCVMSSMKNEGHVAVLFKIDLKYGKDISAFSQFPGEGEVLLMLNDKFFVLSAPRERRVFSARLWVVELAEKDEGRAFRW
eukprot:m51a1_g11040 hypothetical protein (327) ;mRNA; r:443193-444173